MLVACWRKDNARLVEALAAGANPNLVTCSLKKCARAQCVLAEQVYGGRHILAHALTFIGAVDAFLMEALLEAGASPRFCEALTARTIR